MPIKCDEYNRVGVIAVQGDFTSEQAGQVRLAVEDWVGRRGVVDFVIDMEKAPAFDSAGLESLTWLRRRCEALGGQVKLAALGEHCRTVLRLTRLDSRFEAYPDAPAALKTIRDT